jgi:hypothetical protein
MKITYRYFAILIYNTVIIRRTAKGIKLVKSRLYKPGSQFSLIQLTYTGGKVIGTIDYNEWVKRGGARINQNKAVKVDRTFIKGMLPFLQKGDE